MSKIKWIVGVLALIIASWLIWGWIAPIENDLPAEAESRLAYVRDIYQEGREDFLVVDYWVSEDEADQSAEEDNLLMGIDNLKLDRGVEIALDSETDLKIEEFKQAISDLEEPWSETVFKLWLLEEEVIKIEPFVIP